MTSIQDTALLDGLAPHEGIDERTRQILEHRRRTGTTRRRGWLLRRMLMAADVLGLLAAMLLAEAVVVSSRIDARVEVIALVASLPGWVVIAKLYGLYDRDEERAAHSTADEFSAVFHMITVSTFLFWAFSRLTLVFYPTPQKLVIFWAAAIILVTGGRMLARTLARRSVAYLQNAVIVGAGEVGQLIARKLLQHPEYGVNVVGFVDSEPSERREELGHLAFLGHPDRLVELVRLFDIERLIVAFPLESHSELLATLRKLRELDVQIDLVPRLFELVGPKVDMHTVEALPLVGLPPAKLSRSSMAIKRALDVVGAVVGLLLSWPIFLVAAWRIRRESPGPIFFRQTRFGMGMREFTALKFRTMRADTDDSEHREFIKRTMSALASPSSNGLFKLERPDAITPFGRWLRRTSLDELPQLINVLRGEMSLVGPRPCIPYETELFEPRHFDRFLVPQGLTGLWQVTARAHSTFGEALDMDVLYARSWSLGLDLLLLFKTPIQMLRAGGTR